MTLRRNITTLIQLFQLLGRKVMLRSEDGDTIGVVAALLDKAGLAPPPQQRTGQKEM